MMSGTVVPSARSALTFSITGRVNSGFGPNRTPAALALLIPSCWRSRRMSEEIIGKPVTTLIPAELRSEEPAILECIRRGERVDHYQTVRSRKDGSRIDISLTVSPVRNADGKIIGASKIARDITEQKRSEAQIAVLAREAEHRAKNLLAIVQATVHLTKADTTEGLKRAIQGRVQALAKVNALFVQSRWAGAELRKLVMQEFAPYCENDGTRVQISGPDLVLEPTTAQCIAIVLHELATNAAKFGALSISKGRVQIEWSRCSDRLTLYWTETDGPPVKSPTRSGFGTRVMEDMIPRPTPGRDVLRLASGRSRMQNRVLFVASRCIVAGSSV